MKERFLQSNIWIYFIYNYIDLYMFIYTYTYIYIKNFLPGKNKTDKLIIIY